MSDLRTIFSNTFLKQRSDMLVAIGVLMGIVMFIVPLPAFLLDTFMALNLVLSLLVVLIVLYTQRALDFSIFPALLLVTTIFGLALNVSSTRLILSQGSLFEGRLVRAFGTFVVGTGGLEGIVIGVIIFVIIIVVQVVVITKGATRVAEVAARFTLDGLPAKQMAIDAEYSAGAISDEEAKLKKEELQKEVDFYGAMDGAAKFVSGNVKAGIFITVLNIAGGMVIGMTLLGESFELALETYVSLTVGDGLVSQFPALLVSTATGLIVTRAISDGTFGQDVGKQFSRHSKAYFVAAMFLTGTAFLPGFPWYVLLPLAGASVYLGIRLGGAEAKADAAALELKHAEAQPKKEPEATQVAPLDPISLELGYGLVPLVDRDQGAELLERVTRIRREAALDLGLVVPRIRIIDNMRLEPSEYCIKIRGTEVGRGTLRLNHYLSINPGGEQDDLPGERTTDPAFGLPARWITEDYREQAERAGYTVVDSPSIIATHLTEVLKRHASEILGRQEVRNMLDTLKRDYPAVVEDVQSNLGLGEIQKVLQGLLREQVSIRNMVAILEAVADFAGVTKDTGFLTEKARQALGRQICLHYVDDARALNVVTIEPGLEKTIVDSRVDTASGAVPALKPELQRAWINSVSNMVQQIQQKGLPPVILCSEQARPLVRAGIARDLPDVAVLSVPEVADDIRVNSVGEISVQNATVETQAQV